jgi:hypothetical protein
MMGRATFRPLRSVFTAMVIVWGGGLTAHAQADPYLMTDTVVTDCIGELTDSGGPEEAYGNNENLVFTVDSESPLDVVFLGPIDIEAAAPGGAVLFDYLVLHDGPDLASPALDTLYGSIASPPTYTTTGPLTVHFVSDASAQPQGFHLAWMANPPPPDPPVAALSAPGSCPFTALFLDLSFPVECDLVEWTSLTVSADNGAVWTVDTASAAAISCPGGESDMLTLPLASDAPVDGNCTLTATLTVGVRDACDSVWLLPIDATWDATGCGAEPDILLDTDTVCTGGCVLLEAVPRGCGATDISWSASDGSTFSGPGPWEACPATTTTYTATAVETESGITGSTSVTVTVLNLGAWVQDTTLCPGETLPLASGDIQGEWSGNGVLGPPWIFDASESGIGSHTVTFTAFGTASCTSDAVVEVIAFQAPGNIATCPESVPFTLPGQPATGTWTGPGVTGGWTFDPAAVVVPGQDTTVQLTFAANGCERTTNVHIQPAAPPIEFGSVCQSEPGIPLPFSPPGGGWSGPGLSEDGDAFLPEEAPAGPVTLTYQMQGCDRTAFGVVLPIDAGPTSTSCPEQDPFVPFPGFYPSGGTWDGPGIADGETGTGLYDPGLLGDGQWAPLVYSAPNGCTDTLWMFNRQTTVAPDVVHACASDTSNLLASNGFQSSPWCGWWSTLSSGTVTDLGDCNWAARATDFPVGEHEVTYAVNTCIDTLTVIVHPDSLALTPWVFCLSDAQLSLPLTPSGASWSGAGIVAPTDSTDWTWSAQEAGAGFHTLVWTSPSGCTDQVDVEVESAPSWSVSLDSVLCVNDHPVSPPPPTTGGQSSADPSPVWFVDGTAWTGDTTTADLGSGPHTLTVSWTGTACSTTSEWTLEVLPSLTVDLSVDDATLCPGAGTTATASPAGGLAPSGGAILSWSDGGLPLATRTIVPETTSWWSVTADDDCSNPATDSVLLTVLPPFDLAVTAGPTACHGAPTTLLLEALDPPGLTHVFEGNALGTGAQIVDAVAGTAVQWTLIDSIQGCTLDTALLVPGHPPLTAAFSVTPSGDCIAWDAQPLSFIDLSSGTESGQWSWTPLQVEGQGAEADSIAWAGRVNPQLTVPAAGSWSIELIVTQAAGCADTLEQTVCILPQTSVWLPDAFSPNADGANDRLRPRGSGVSQWHMTVHDGWGRLVWEESQQGLPSGTALHPTTDAGFPVGWDGEGHPVGVYAVRLNALTDGGVPVLLEQPIRLIR